MFEQHILVGNLGADPEMRYTPSEKAVTNFSLAVNERWTNSDGSTGERTTWFRVACWGRLAEVTNEHLRKGRRVMVIGSRLEAEAYLDREGKPAAALKLTASSVKFLDSNGDSTYAEEPEDIPF